MCGITGQFNFFSTGASIEQDRLLRMTRSLSHRGPDDEGTYRKGPVGLGFRRLAILDLSPAGHQPMHDPTGNVWLVFNGEIYNFRELRRELEGLGHVFRSESDTEVIVLGYVEWGDAVLKKLNGMFGLAIWDEGKSRLLVARDAMGVKPIYYSVRQGVVTFGSEIRAVLEGLDCKPAPDPLGLSLFLRYRYTPAPHTAFAGVRKLAPGEMLVAENGDLKICRWYEFEPSLYEPQPTDSEAAEALLDIYKGAVQRHLVSDVPVGLLLSGGMDSGLLLGLMRLNGENWPTYTVGYGASFQDDELADAAETARYYGATNTAVHIDQTTFEAMLPKIIGSVEEPIASSSIVPMYLVCERARQDVKVVLMGQGPDELFGGYKRHLGVAYGGAWRKLPLHIRGALMAGARGLQRPEWLRRSLDSLGIDERMRRYQHVFSIVSETTIHALFQPGILPSGARDAVLACWEPHRLPIEKLDELGGFQLLELRSSLADELLMYGDKLSMAHSLEARVPFLDREVVEYAQRLGQRFKVRMGQRKWLHRRVCRKFLPEKIVRRKKRGFAVNVVDEWFRSSVGGKMMDYFEDRASLMYGFLCYQEVARLLSEHRAGLRDNHKILFSLVVLEEWLRTRCVGIP